MKIINSNFKKNSDLPLKLNLSFEAIFEYLEKIAQDKKHVLHNTAIELLEEYKQYPILKEGFDDFKYLEKYNNEISRLLEILFPDLLQTNEIKAASIPFEFTTFNVTKRFEKILEDAGEDYEFVLRNFDEENIYIMACTFILEFHYKMGLNIRRPFYFDIPNKKTGFTQHYRALFNGDFFKVKPLVNAPKITDKDIKLLLNNFNNIDLWREKFPPNSYEFRGFGLMSLVDMTPDYLISNLKENLINKDQKGIDGVEHNISLMYGSKDIKFEFSTFTLNDGILKYRYFNNKKSFIIQDSNNSTCNGHFCDGILKKVFLDKQILAISDLEEYGKITNNNGISETLLSQGIQSIILAPIQLSDELFGVMEVVSKNKFELNSLNANKLEDIIPVFKIAAKRYLNEFENKLESVIQRHYTSIHPSVKWKFYEAAEMFVANEENGITENNKLQEIVFKNVIPLYGQSDIKGSSLARNNAIQKDLITQFSMAYNVIEKAKKTIDLPIYTDLQFRIEEYSSSIKNGLNSSDEINLTYFLKNDIHPVFNHLKTLNTSLRATVNEYMDAIDPNLNVVYDERKKYDESVNILNDQLAKFIDLKQVEAQKMFPHYFERYKTDGIDYNMYIGQSLLNNKTYDKIYLYNLRLWQLQMMCELENVVYNLKDELEHPLEVASLILVHSTPLTIKFRMDEKRFDVDGAYNIRYEILKKRIDKAHIKNSTERLTIPGKIAIVYSQDNEADEYLKYIKHLQAKKYIKGDVELVEIEDLQGSIGLKAIRIQVNYQKMKINKKITLDDLMDVIKNEN